VRRGLVSEACSATASDRPSRVSNGFVAGELNDGALPARGNSLMRRTPAGVGCD
jgi:hypothetical protein